MTTYDVYEIDVTTSVTSTNLRPHIERLHFTDATKNTIFYSGSIGVSTSGEGLFY